MTDVECVCGPPTKRQIRAVADGCGCGVRLAKRANKCDDGSHVQLAHARMHAHAHVTHATVAKHNGRTAEQQDRDDGHRSEQMGLRPPAMSDIRSRFDSNSDKE